jgi:hypothetical protein
MHLYEQNSKNNHDLPKIGAEGRLRVQVIYMSCWRVSRKKKKASAI